MLAFHPSSVSTIGEATLQVYGDSSSSASYVQLGAYGVATTSWGESTVTWNNQPSRGSLLSTTEVSGTSNAWYSLDLTGYLQQQKAAGYNTVSIELYMLNTPNEQANLNSKEASSDGPQLVINSADASLAPTNDAYVYQHSPTTNYGTSTVLYTKATTSSYSYNTYITFNTAGVTGTVTNASIQLYGSNSGGTDMYVPVSVYPVSTTTWSQSTIDWSNAPTAGSTAIGGSTIIIDNTNREYTWDVSSYVNAQRAAGHDTVSFMIQAGEVTATAIPGFNSTNATSNTPHLVLSESGGPTVATAASATPSPVTGTTTALSVLGADPAGESTLTYTWSATSVPSGASAPTFSANGTNAAKNATATFSAAGAYSFLVTIEDASGATTTSSVNVTVNPTLTSVSLTPTPVALNENATQQFAAIGYDQFGAALATQPTFTWSSSGVGSVSSTGLYTAPGSDGAGSATVTATSGGVSGHASVTVSDAAPTVATAASASPGTVTGTTTALSVLGADDGGESNLTYTWSASSVPSGATAPTFSSNGTNGSKNSTATFSAAGNYTFLVAIADAEGLSTTSSVAVTVDQTPTTIVVTPGSAGVDDGTTQQFSAQEFDQFGAAMSVQPTFTWSVDSGGVGSVNSTGLYTAPTTGANTDNVRATDGAISGVATVAVAASGPSVATAANVSLVDDPGILQLGVLGSDPNGESSLTYTWAVSSAPVGATVGFTDNGDNDAKYAMADVSMAGTYSFTVTISDGTNNVTSSTSISIYQTLTEIDTTQGGAPVINGETKTFTAVAYDQFGNSMATQPTFTWSAQAGSITSGGTYTAPSSGAGSDQLTVSSGGVSGSATVEYGAYVGTVYEDANGNGEEDPGEGGLAGWTVYVDQNGNGIFDNGEPSATTDAFGDYSMAACGSGCQTFRVVQQAAFNETGADDDIIGAPTGEADFGQALAAPAAPRVTCTGDGGNVGAPMSLDSKPGGDDQDSRVRAYDGATGDELSLSGVNVSITGGGNFITLGAAPSHRSEGGLTVPIHARSNAPVGIYNLTITLTTPSGGPIGSVSLRVNVSKP